MFFLLLLCAAAIVNGKGLLKQEKWGFFWIRDVHHVELVYDFLVAASALVIECVCFYSG